MLHVRDYCNLSLFCVLTRSVGLLSFRTEKLTGSPRKDTAIFAAVCNFTLWLWNYMLREKCNR